MPLFEGYLMTSGGSTETVPVLQKKHLGEEAGENDTGSGCL